MGSTQVDTHTECMAASRGCAQLSLEAIQAADMNRTKKGKLGWRLVSRSGGHDINTTGGLNMK